MDVFDAAIKQKYDCINKNELRDFLKWMLIKRTMVYVILRLTLFNCQYWYMYKIWYLWSYYDMDLNDH